MTVADNAQVPVATPVAGPTSSAWREEVLTRAKELDGLATWIRDRDDHHAPRGELLDAIRCHLAAATCAADPKGQRIKSAWRRLTGSAFERGLGNLDAVEVHLVRLAPERSLKGWLPSISAHVNRFLAKDDPRRLAVNRIPETGTYVLTAGDRDVLATALHAANTQRRRNLLRVRGFRNLLAGGIAVFFAIAIVVGVIGARHPTAIPLCFAPESGGRVKVVCPLGETSLPTVETNTHDFDPDVARTVSTNDLWVVELLGLLGAALAGAATLRRLTGATSTPYAVPVALVLFKLPTGAVSAVVGLLLVRAEFVPGLSALDSRAQILGWAVLLGVAQQLVTRIVDTQASGLLENVGGRGAAGDRQPAVRPAE
jgi:hypothetical protein